MGSPLKNKLCLVLNEHFNMIFEFNYTLCSALSLSLRRISRLEKDPHLKRCAIEKDEYCK